MSAAFDLVMFDLDGTLVDTAPEISDGVNAWLAELSLPPVPESSVRKWIGHGTATLLRHVLENGEGRDLLREPASLDSLMVSFSRHYYAHCGSRSSLYPQVRETLEELRARSVKLALISNKEERFALPVLDAHGLRESFDLLICGDTLAEKKPSALPLLHCILRLGSTLDRALMVGDSEIDIAAARNAGVRVWAVPYGYNHGNSIEHAHPDRVITSLADVMKNSGTARAAA